jgi:hypothetical protein
MLELTVSAIGWIARALASLFAELVIHTFFYGLGWLVLKAVTFGRFPPPRSLVRDYHTSSLVILVGVITFVITLFVLLH